MKSHHYTFLFLWEIRRFIKKQNKIAFFCRIFEFIIWSKISETTTVISSLQANNTDDNRSNHDETSNTNQYEGCRAHRWHRAPMIVNTFIADTGAKTLQPYQHVSSDSLLCDVTSRIESTDLAIVFLRYLFKCTDYREHWNISEHTGFTSGKFLAISIKNFIWTCAIMIRWPGWNDQGRYQQKTNHKFIDHCVF